MKFLTVYANVGAYFQRVDIIIYLMGTILKYLEVYEKVSINPMSTDFI